MPKKVLKKLRDKIVDMKNRWGKNLSEYYKKLISTGEANMLSQQALETLAIIAYNQPITRAEVDELRGLSSSFMIRKLVAKGLTKYASRRLDKMQGIVDAPSYSVMGEVRNVSGYLNG